MAASFPGILSSQNTAELNLDTNARGLMPWGSRAFQLFLKGGCWNRRHAGQENSGLLAYFILQQETIMNGFSFHIVGCPLKTNNGGWRQRVPRGFLNPTLLLHNKRLSCDLVWSHCGRDISLDVIQAPRPKSAQFLTWHCDLFPSRNTDKHHELLGLQPSPFIKITSLTTIYCNY